MKFVIEVTLADHPERSLEEIADDLLDFLCGCDGEILDVVSYNSCDPLPAGSSLVP